MKKQSHASRIVEYVRFHGSLGSLKQTWIHFWMLFAGTGPVGRFAAWLVTWFVPPHYGRWWLRSLHPKGFVAPSATLYGKDIRLGPNIFIDDHALLSQLEEGGPIEIGAKTAICRNTIITTAQGGTVTIGEGTRLQPHCFLSAAQGSIQIGANVGIAPYCAFYPHDHGTSEAQQIGTQSLVVKGDIVVEDEAWLGHGVTVLSGARIGRGAVIGAGSTVADDVPAGAFAWGVPAKVFKKRENSGDALSQKRKEGPSNGMNGSTAEQVRKIASEVYMCTPDESSGAPPEILIDWDSMQRLNLVLALEEKFSVTLAPDEIERMKTVADYAALVEMKRNQ